MNKSFFDNLISSYNFKLKKSPEDIKGIYKYYELTFEDISKRPDLTLYWYEDDTFSLYRNEGFAVVKLCGDKMNIYNLKLSVEKYIPNKLLKNLNI